jgi:hypothetical protein
VLAGNEGDFSFHLDSSSMALVRAQASSPRSA